jgi:hypothetical protein
MAAVVEAAVVTTEHPKKAPPRPQVQDWPKPETVDRQPTKAPHPRKSRCRLGRALPALPTQNVQFAVRAQRSESPSEPLVVLVAARAPKPP